MIIQRIHHVQITFECRDPLGNRLGVIMEGVS
jgi:hypothetical protein